MEMVVELDVIIIIIIVNCWGVYVHKGWGK